MERAFFAVKIMKNQPNNPHPVFVIAVMVLLIPVAVFFFSIQTIEPGHVGIVVRLGQAQPDALQEGFHLVIPFVSTVHVMDVRIQKKEVKTAAASKDLQMVNAEITVNFRVDKDKSVKLYREIGKDYIETVIMPAIQEAFKSGSAKYTAEALITERTVVSAGIRESISERLMPFGVMIEAINITNFEFSPEFNRAIEEKMTAEQRALQAEKELERFKFEARQAVETAKGAAEAVLEKAKAESEAMLLKRQYASPEVIWLTALEKWDGRLPTHLFGASPIPVFDLKDESAVSAPKISTPPKLPLQNSEVVK